MKIPKLYPIVDRATLDARGISVGAFAAELAAAGVGILQYRDKVNGPQEVLRAAAEISAAFAGRECLLVMNDRADLAVLAGWGGVHVGQGDLGVEDVRAVLGASPHSSAKSADEWGTHARSGFPSGMTNKEDSMGFVGVSTHTVEQVRAVDMQGPEYVAVGPVFATSTKADAEAVVGLEGVRRARALTAAPLVAIGGITRENAWSVIEAGADSVAVISGLFVEGISVRESVEDFLERLR
jgi:thiamine-phosphate pyrophosphorylase